jgi:phenylacetate-CoA ligase
MFVRPPADCRGDPEFSHRRLVVTRDGERDVMKLMAEAAAASEALCKEIAASFGAVTKLGGYVELAANHPLTTGR